MPLLRPTHAVIDLDAIESNIRGIRHHLGSSVRLLVAVKADAYGHGMIETARVAVEAGVDMLGVAILEEGVALREAGFTIPILILGASLPEQSGCILQHRLTPMVCTVEMAQTLSAQAVAMNRIVDVHVKVDTGMGRVGVPVDQGLAFYRKVAAMPGLRMEGVFTHFACADEKDRTFTRRQLGLFGAFVRELEREGLRPPITHVANSGAILNMPESHLDMVRAGLMVYGYYPSPWVLRSVTLKSALTWKTRIVYLKTVPSESGISYGRMYVTPKKTVIATLPVGYDDGFPRILSNRGEVLVRGRRAPVVGRVCMDQCLIDVGHIPEASIGDEVVLIGKQADQEISVDAFARMAGTIPNEIVCGIGKRVPRVYARDKARQTQ